MGRIHIPARKHGGFESRHRYMGRQIRKEEKVAEFELALKELNGVSAEMSEMEFAAVKEVRRSEKYLELLTKRKDIHKKLNKVYGG